MSRDDLPLVTMWVKAYRQENLVAEAIESVFAQTYPNLEIILSDDASPDGTFRVMEEMAAAYRGPHRVRLNRNPRNLGIVGHTNRLWELAEGELVTGCAGDDVAEPNKVARLVEAWLEDPDDIVIVHSATLQIDLEGRVIGRREPACRTIEDPSPRTLVEPHANGIGAAAMYHRRILSTFGPIPRIAMVEDGPLFFRGAMIGRLAYVPEELVRYRVGGVSNPTETQGRHDEPPPHLYGFPAKVRAWTVTNARTFLLDMEKVDFAGKPDCRAACERIVNRDGFRVDLFHATYWGRLKMLPEALRRSFNARNARLLFINLQYVLGPLYIGYYRWRQSRAV